MALSTFLQRALPATPTENLNQAIAQQQQQALNAQAIQSGQEKAQDKRRTMAISMLNGIASEQDPEKQALLYEKLRPLAMRYDTTLELPEQYDPLLTGALSKSQISPTDLMNDQRIRENAQLMAGFRQEQAAMRDAAAQEAAAAKAEQQAQAAADRGAQAYSQRVDQAGLAELLPAVNNTVDKLAPYTQPGADVPGFGGMAGMLPDWAVSQDGKDLRQAYAGVRNAVLKARSGGAVTPSESERLLQELGEGTMLPDEQVIKGMSNVSAFLRDRIANLQAGFSPEAMDTYRQRGGTVTTDAVRSMGGPKVGTEEDGYVFMGGNPADPKAWKKR